MELGMTECMKEAIRLAVAAAVTSLQHILEVSDPCISLHIRIHLTQKLSHDLVRTTRHVCWLVIHRSPCR